jgi:hypothetical protein
MASNSLRVRVPKDLWHNAENWAKKELNVPAIKTSDVFRFVYHNTLHGDYMDLINKPAKPPTPWQQKRKALFGVSGNKRGSWLDVGYFMLLVSFFAICLIIGVFLLNVITDAINTNPNFGVESKTFATKVTDRFTTTSNGMFLILVVGLAITSIMLAVLVRVHPIFIPIFIIALVFLIWVSGSLSDMYQEMAARPEMAASAASLSVVSTVMEYLPLFVAVVGILIMIVMYKQWRS